MRQPLIIKYLRGALVRNPPKYQHIPTWDLPTVLLSLSNHPFEPIEGIDLKFLTLKTVFLVAIGSANRVHELKALDCRPAFCQFGPNEVTLRTRDGFRPKVVKPSNMNKVLHFTALSSLQNESTMGYEPVCIYRAVKRYIQVTAPLRKNTTQLFVTYQSGRQGKEASKTTIAKWLKMCIQEAYTRQHLPLPSVQAHSTRKQSVSWADMNNISIKDICQQATWSSSNVFIKHYKLDMASSVSSSYASSVLRAAKK